MPTMISGFCIRTLTPVGKLYSKPFFYYYLYKIWLHYEICYSRASGEMCGIGAYWYQDSHQVGQIVKTYHTVFATPALHNSKPDWRVEPPVHALAPAGGRRRRQDGLPHDLLGGLVSPVGVKPLHLHLLQAWQSLPRGPDVSNHRWDSPQSQVRKVLCAKSIYFPFSHNCFFQRCHRGLRPSEPDLCRAAPAQH